MIRWEHLGTAAVPDGGGELRLMRRGQEFSIMAPGGIELMNSRLSGSEEALARLAVDRVGEAAHLLVGGYGMGFTLRAALAALGPKGRVTVAELVPEVIDWARGPMAQLTAGGLDDPRTEVALGDVGELIRARPGAFDAILLDVDNGPEGLSRPANDRIYDAGGLAAAKAALKPGGVLAVWSSAPSTAFTKRLRGAGLAVEELSVRASIHKRGGRHTIWMAGRGR